jgi:hypothetical protein
MRKEKKTVRSRSETMRELLLKGPDGLLFWVAERLIRVLMVCGRGKMSGTSMSKGVFASVLLSVAVVRMGMSMAAVSWSLEMGLLCGEAGEDGMSGMSMSKGMSVLLLVAMVRMRMGAVGRLLGMGVSSKEESGEGGMLGTSMSKGLFVFGFVEVMRIGLGVAAVRCLLRFVRLSG